MEKLALKSKALANEYEEIDPEDVAIVEGKVYNNVSTIGYDFFQEALQQQIDLLQIQKNIQETFCTSPLQGCTVFDTLTFLYKKLLSQVTGI